MHVMVDLRTNMIYSILFKFYSFIKSTVQYTERIRAFNIKYFKFGV